jgi:hypothetical protein
MQRFAAIAVSASLVINSAAFAAQQSASKPPSSPSTSLRESQRVRVTNESGQLIGTVVSVATDSVRITDGAQERTIPLAGVRRIDVSRGTTSKGAGAKKGAIRWGLTMAAIGAVSLGVQHDQVGDGGSSAGEAVALGLWSGGLFGALIGAGVGAARAGEKWEKVWP